MDYVPEKNLKEFKQNLAINGNLNKNTVVKSFRHIDNVSHELDQMRTQVDNLRRTVDQSVKNERLAVAHAEQLKDQNARLQQSLDLANAAIERHAKMLNDARGAEKRAVDMVNRHAQELNKVLNSKKVKLPRDVAEAIEEIRYSKDGITDYGILRVFTDSTLYKGARDALKRMHTVMSFSLLMQALVNGYTIAEEPTQHTLEHDIRQIIESLGSGNLDVDEKVSLFAHKIGEYIEKVYDEKQSG